MNTNMKKKKNLTSMRLTFNNLKIFKNLLFLTLLPAATVFLV